MCFKLHFIVLLFLYHNSFSFIAYLKIEIFCANDFPSYINSSEGNYPTLNPQEKFLPKELVVLIMFLNLMK